MNSNTIQTEQYETLWQQKTAETLSLFDGLTIPQAETYASPSSGFRMRAEFKAWHEGSEWNYGMFEKGSNHTPYIVEEFPIASDAIQALMPRLREAMIGSEELSRRLFQIDFLNTLHGDMLVTLIYHRKLTDEWLEHALALAAQLDIKIIGRARKQKICTHDDWVLEALDVNDETFYYQQKEGSFTQPNAFINQTMLSWACEQVGQNTDDLLELYCGNGNFTLPLARQFNKVLATEISKTSINSALFNCERNNTDNIEFIRMSSEDFTDALNGVREFRRLKDVELDEYNINTVLVDPPRSGLDDGTLSLISRYSRIVYISCNPETLVNNLKALESEFKIEKLAFFDQFPYTHHIETGVVLVKR
ncbi:tRNA (uridine(54)-C5)-methyltransferase TrmA [Leucothrix sargassi]|nr:tRNA (uridine(54)-C5)-methyltransferase TrmA [Leucothrix sargassi]